MAFFSLFLYDVPHAASVWMGGHTGHKLTSPVNSPVHISTIFTGVNEHAMPLEILVAYT